MCESQGAAVALCGHNLERIVCSSCAPIVAPAPSLPFKALEGGRNTGSRSYVAGGQEMLVTVESRLFSRQAPSLDDKPL